MPELSRSLQPCHITMIPIGGMIGAALFVSSSSSIVVTGPAIVPPARRIAVHARAHQHVCWLMRGASPAVRTLSAR